LSINIGNIYAKKSLVEDTADAIGPILLANQLERWIPTQEESQNNTPLPKAGSITASTTATTILAQLTESTGDDTLAGASLTPTFGIWNPTSTPPFCAFNEPCMALINQTISETDPNLNNVVLQSGEDFAVAFQIQYPVLPLGDLLDFDGVTLNGKAVHKTKLPTEDDYGIFGEPDPDNGEDCCCKAAALVNNTKTITVSTSFFIFSSITCYKDYSPTSDTTPDKCGYHEDPGDGVCDEKCESFSFFSFFGSGDASATCDYYAACHDTFWESFFSGNIFGYFLEIRRCWFGQTFLQKLIQSIEKINTTVDDAWDGWV
jgi:hypothetical protein